jgi:hypothetical protein
MPHAFAIALMCVAACTESNAEFPGPPELTLGFGNDAFTPITDGVFVPIVTAPQGGTIVWAAVAARYLDPEELELLFTVVPPEGAPSLKRAIVDLDDADGGFATGVRTGLPVFLFDEHLFAGSSCLWRVEARDREGRTAVDENMVLLARTEP